METDQAMTQVFGALAIAVKDGRILAVGSRAELEQAHHHPRDAQARFIRPMRGH
jgi:predicted amidohydrolase YtcJ